MVEPVTGVMAAALAAHRDRCNALVAAARRGHADFDTSSLERQLRGPVATLVEACDRVLPGSGQRVLAAVIGPVVELVAQHRLGGGTHDALLATLPRLARAVAGEPRLVVGSLANAVVHLERTGVPVDEWLARLPPSDPSTVLRAGQVAAWSLGLSQSRRGALDVAATLDAEVLGQALGAGGPLPVADTVDRLRADRWWRPGGAAAGGRSEERAPRIAHRVGGFRGFGGPFLALPVVGRRDDELVVRSGTEAWTLHADVFGATLTRTEADRVLVTPHPDAVVPAGIRPLSMAAVGDLAAVTIATSYHVLVMEPGS